MAFGHLDVSVPSKSSACIARREKNTNNGSDDKNHEGRSALYCFQPPSKVLPAGSIKQNHEIGPGVCGYARRGGFEVDAEIRAR